MVVRQYTHVLLSAVQFKCSGLRRVVRLWSAMASPPEDGAVASPRGEWLLMEAINLTLDASADLYDPKVVEK